MNQKRFISQMSRRHLCLAAFLLSGVLQGNTWGSETLLPGYRQEASLGAARGSQALTSAFWVNPAQSTAPNGASLESGVFGIGESISTYGAFTMPAGKWNSLGLAWTAWDLGDMPVQTFSALVNLNPSKKFNTGITGILQRSGNDNFMDFNIGMSYVLNPSWTLGLDVRHVSQNLDSSSYYPDNQRQMGLGISWKPLFGKFRQHWETSLDYDIRRLTLEDSRLTWVNDINLGPINNLNLIASGSWKSPTYDNAFDIGGGLRIQERFYKWRLGLFYRMGLHNISGSEDSYMNHGVGITVLMSPDRDLLAPVVSASVDRSRLRVRAEKPEFIHFALESSDRSRKYRSWHLVLSSTNSEYQAEKIVRSFNGKGIAPRNIRWDGKGSDGHYLNPGIYTYRFIVVDAQGNKSATSWQLIEISDL